MMISSDEQPFTWVGESIITCVFVEQIPNETFEHKRCSPKGMCGGTRWFKAILNKNVPQWYWVLVKERPRPCFLCLASEISKSHHMRFFSCGDM